MLLFRAVNHVRWYKVQAVQQSHTKHTTIGAVVSGRNTKAGGWWWGLGTGCWVVRRNNCFLAATVVEDVVHGWDGCFTQFKAEQTNDVEKGSTVELDAVDHGLHHICLAGGTHERDTKGMGECSNTLQGHNNNFFFLLWWCNTLKGVSLSMLFFFRRTNYLCTIQMLRPGTTQRTVPAIGNTGFFLFLCFLGFIPRRLQGLTTVHGASLKALVQRRLASRFLFLRLAI